MTSALAALLFVGLLAALMRRDIRQNPDQSSALWIPLIWMFLAGGRWMSSWLNLRPPMDSPDAFAEGSPVDRITFLLLIVAGSIVLLRRSLSWGDFTRRNLLLVLYFAYCLVSALWSDDPGVTIKRWFKDLGNPIMALVILTDPNPVKALTTLLRRLAYLFLVLSVLFIKYYPELGRSYHYDGSPMYTGVGQQKNHLGQMCLLAGIYFAWLIVHSREQFRALARSDRWIIFGLVACMAWLQTMSNSQTALSCLLVCIFITVMTRLPWLRTQPSRIPVTLVVLAFMLLALEGLFELKAAALEALGRRPDLTDRTKIWGFLLGMGTNPVIGTGFMNFWMGDRLEAVWQSIGTIIQAHSGYIEQYLNLGLVGVGFIVLLMAQAILRIRQDFNGEPALATLRLCFLIAAAMYNYTEAAFYGISNVWILFLIAVLRAPTARLTKPLSVRKQTTTAATTGASPILGRRTNPR